MCISPGYCVGTSCVIDFAFEVSKKGKTTHFGMTILVEERLVNFAVSGWE